jgi:hypothetical protein
MKSLFVNNIDEACFKEIPTEDKYRLAHHLGHMTIAKCFQIDWNQSLNLDNHNIDAYIQNHAIQNGNRIDTNEMAIKIYCAGYAAEMLFEPEKNIVTECTETRLLNDIKMMHPYIEKKLKSGTTQIYSPADPVSKGIIEDTYEEYVNFACSSLATIAKMNNITVEQYLNRGILRLWTYKSSKIN